MAYNSKYTGEQVEELLDGVEGKQDKLEHYSENSYSANLDAGNVVLTGQVNVGTPLNNKSDFYVYAQYVDVGVVQIDCNVDKDVWIAADSIKLTTNGDNKATYNGEEIATLKDLADIITLHELQGKYTFVDLCEMMSYWFLKVPGSFYIRDIKIVGYDGETKKCKIQFDFISKYGGSTNVYIGSYQTGTLYGEFPCAASSDYVHYAESSNYYFSIPYDVDVVDGEFVEMNSGEKLYIYGRD